MPIRVGLLPFLNSVVFYRGTPWPNVDFYPMAPRQMAQAIKTGDLDAGPLPVTEVFRLGDSVVPLGNLCVATRDSSDSVLLFSSVPADSLNRMKIGLTDQSSTSVQLLRLLLSEHWNVTPDAYIGLEPEAKALLYIGDEALKRRHGIEGYPFMYDLAVEWRNYVNLPFVFATWVVRNEVAKQGLETLLPLLEQSLRHMVPLVPSEVKARPDLGMSANEVFEYLSHFTYQAGATEQHGLIKFRYLLDSLPYWHPSKATMGLSQPT